ncbi:TonB-dependent receptor [Sphingomonas sp. ERG5]|uniref:TonB-dependent receptor n=1 Tax=Sphingomonas sp. ERG5 TaxID=1381597 RepID=UPI00054BD66B|nr:TonB-dependent receptor [Sphingomonas sp. ERG5]
MLNGHLIARAGLAAVLLGTTCLSSVVAAQTLAPPPADSAAAPLATQDTPDATPVVANDEGPDIIVTGTRRSERLQDVAVAITAVSGEALAKTGYTSASDLQYVVPSLTFNNSQGAGFSIRGFGSQSFDYNLEKSVSVVLDDVVQGLPRSIGFNTFADVERVEVLEGPQGTLFGKNASAGVVFVVTRKPEIGVASVQGSVRYGTDNETQIENTVNLPISDTLAARISGTYQKRDGYLFNAFTQSKEGGYRDVALRAKLLWQPTADIQAITTAEYFDHRDDGYNIIENVRSLTPYATPPSSTSQTNLDYATIFAQYGFAAGTKNQTYLANNPWYGYVKQKGISENITASLGDYTLTSITAYKHQSSGNFNDPDYTATDFYTLNRNRLKANQFSQELRLNSPTGRTFDYIVGLFYYRQNASAFEAQAGKRNRTDLPPLTYVNPVGSGSAYGSQQRSYAAFGEGNLHLTRKLSLIGGLRITHDKVSGDYAPTTDFPYTYIGTIPPAIAGSAKATDLTGKATIQYKPSPDIMAYATYARGYKSPAIGTSRGVLRPVKQENVDSFEVGIKSQFFDRRLTLNLTGYVTNFSNFQANTFILQPNGDYLGLLGNAPKVEARGFEISTSLRATPDLTLSGNFTYNHSKYQGFLVGCYANQPVNAAPGPGCYRQGASLVNDASDTDVILAPRVVYNLGANYEPRLTETLKLFSSVNWSHRASTLSVAGDPGTRIPAYGLLNGTIGVGAIDGRLRLSVYGRNLLDTLFIARLRPLPFGPTGSYLQTVAGEGRRTIGVRLDYAF